MLVNDIVFKEDIDRVIMSYKSYFEELDGKNVFVTGATGLIGSNFVNALLYYNSLNKASIKVIALVRSEEKAKQVFGSLIGDNLKIVSGDVCRLSSVNIEDDIDYIVHGASVTSSKDFVQKPVETISTAYEGTKEILELAKRKKVKSIVYLSTMEVYGNNTEEIRIKENDIGYLNPLTIRNSYPESKKMCECMCAAYFGEYALPVKVLRLTQTFGTGVQYNDGRVFAEFARCVIENKNIVLHTKGETKRSYLYTADAVSAILVVMLEGKNGEAYHAANESSYCSVYEMACMVSEIDESKIEVVIEEDSVDRGYAPTLLMNLDTEKICSLGWKAEVSLEDMYKNMIKYMELEKKDE